MAENYFSKTLRHHLNQTRAGLYGQFEHAFNFNTGPDQNAALKIGPGESITFTGKLLESEQVCTLIATNNLTSTSGAGYAASSVVANSRTIVIPLKPKQGNATFEFSCPGADVMTEVVSHVFQDFGSFSEHRWDAIDENNTRIFTKTTGDGFTNDIVSSQAGDYYCSAFTIGPAGDGDGFLAVFEADGTFKWRAKIDRDNTFASTIAYDEVSEVVVSTQIDGGAQGTVRVVGYDASLNQDQGGLGEPPALYETVVCRNLRAAAYSLQADGNGSFIATTKRNNEWDGASGAFAHVFKIDAASGNIVATFDIGDEPFGREERRVAICPVTGNIAVSQLRESSLEGSPMNVMILDSDLNLVSSDLVPWVVPAGGRINYVRPTFDETGRLFIVTSNGFMVRYTDSTLTNRDIDPLNLFAPVVIVFANSVGDVDHNKNGNLIISAGGGDPSGLWNNTAHILRFDNDGVAVSDYLVPTGAATGRTRPGRIHVRQATGPGPDLGGFFTQELSMTPPGRQRSVAAVKYAAGNITGIFFNSVEVEFDPSKWTAVHSVHGPVPIGQLAPGWEYNSPL